jgi:hypothetical protein
MAEQFFCDPSMMMSIPMMSTPAGMSGPSEQRRFSAPSSLLAFLLVFSMMLAGNALATEPTPAGATPAAPASSPDGLPSVKQIEAKIAEVAADTMLDEAGKAALTEQYRRALANLEATRAFEQQANELAKTLTTAPAETAAIQQRLAAPGASDAGEIIPQDLPTEDIAQRLSIILADAAVEETRIGELDKAIERSAGRPAAIRARLSEVKTALGEIEADPSQPKGDSAETASSEALRWTLETRRASLWAEGRMLEQELLSQPAREALHRAQREEATRAWESLRARQRQLEELQNQRRRDEAEAAQRESERARLEAADKHALVQEATLENAEITTSTGDLARRLESLDLEIEQIEAERKRVEQDFKAAQQRIEAAGLSKALGQVLVERRDQIPDLRQYRRVIQDREDAIAEATLRQIRYREEQRHLRSLDAYLDDLTARDPSAQAPEVREQLKKTLDQRLRLIAQALIVEDDYIRQLGELNYAADQLIRTGESYDSYLAERLLWVRSTLPVGLETLADAPVRRRLAHRTRALDRGRTGTGTRGSARAAALGRVARRRTPVLETLGAAAGDPCDRRAVAQDSYRSPRPYGQGDRAQPVGRAPGAAPAVGDRTATVGVARGDRLHPRTGCGPRQRLGRSLLSARLPNALHDRRGRRSTLSLGPGDPADDPARIRLVQCLYRPGRLDRLGALQRQRSRLRRESRALRHGRDHAGLRGLLRTPAQSGQRGAATASRECPEGMAQPPATRLVSAHRRRTARTGAVDVAGLRLYGGDPVRIHGAADLARARPDRPASSHRALADRHAATLGLGGGGRSGERATRTGRGRARRNRPEPPRRCKPTSPSRISPHSTSRPAA